MLRRPERRWSQRSSITFETCTSGAGGWLPLRLRLCLQLWLRCWLRRRLRQQFRRRCPTHQRTDLRQQCIGRHHWLVAGQQVTHLPQGIERKLQRLTRLRARRHGAKLDAGDQGFQLMRQVTHRHHTSHPRATLYGVQRTLECGELLRARLVKTDALERGLRFLQQFRAFLTEDGRDLRIVARCDNRLGSTLEHRLGCRLERRLRHRFGERSGYRFGHLLVGAGGLHPAGTDATIQCRFGSSDALQQRLM